MFNKKTGFYQNAPYPTATVASVNKTVSAFYSFLLRMKQDVGDIQQTMASRPRCMNLNSGITTTEKQRNERKTEIKTKDEITKEITKHKGNRRN